MRPGSSDESVICDVIENDCYSVQKMNIQRAHPLVFDMGGNIGAFSKMILKRWPTAQIRAFEPHPLNFGVLSHNLMYANAKCELGAVQGKRLPHRYLVERAEDEKKDIYGGWNVIQRTNEYCPDGSFEVGLDCQFFDPEPIMAEARLSDRDVIVKMDIEAAEFHVIDRWSDETLRSIDYLVGEFHLDAFNLDYYQSSPWSSIRSRLLRFFDCPEIEDHPVSSTGKLFEFFATAKHK